ncbi:hypothetical protein T492DRAFT_833238 [Pavlovales sp. CCMP2436]|nr:hypothetical protein T492DRAFT_833238 [Pavlovales sp. CCMP2436]
MTLFLNSTLLPFLASSSFTKFTAAAVLFVAARTPSAKVQSYISKMLYTLGVTITLGLSKWKFTSGLWNATIEPLFIDLLENMIMAFKEGFIGGLRSDKSYLVGNGLKPAVIVENTDRPFSAVQTVPPMLSARHMQLGNLAVFTFEADVNGGSYFVPLSLATTRRTSHLVAVKGRTSQALLTLSPLQHGFHIGINALGSSNGVAIGTLFLQIKTVIPFEIRPAIQICLAIAVAVLVIASLIAQDKTPWIMYFNISHKANNGIHQLIGWNEDDTGFCPAFANGSRALPLFALWEILPIPM